MRAGGKHEVTSPSNSDVVEITPPRDVSIAAPSRPADASRALLRTLVNAQAGPRLAYSLPSSTTLSCLLSSHFWSEPQELVGRRKQDENRSNTRPEKAR